MKSAAELIASGAYLLDSLKNSVGQKMHVYEHPLFGEEAPFLVKFEETGNCYQTNCCDLSDLCTDDYELIDVITDACSSELKCGFELTDYEKFTIKYYGQVN